MVAVIEDWKQPNWLRELERRYSLKELKEKEVDMDEC